MKSLTTIFNQNMTDKGSRHGGRHNYGALYGTILESWRERPVRLLEFGVAYGHSLKSWLEFFPQAEVVGVDRDLSHLNNELVDCRRLRLVEADATHVEPLLEGEFDLIIDDADHCLATQMALLESSWPRLKVSGLYLIEDLFTGALPWGGRASGPRGLGFYFHTGCGRGVGDNCLPQHPQDINFLSGKSLTRGVREILECNEHFYAITSVAENGGLHMALVVRKAKLDDGDRQYRQPPLQELSGMDYWLSLGRRLFFRVPPSVRQRIGGLYRRVKAA